MYIKGGRATKLYRSKEDAEEDEAISHRFGGHVCSSGVQRTIGYAVAQGQHTSSVKKFSDDEKSSM